ncbi:MAG: hypothetical protein ACOYY3_02005 [Chloroflexota bacterium]
MNYRTQAGRVRKPGQRIKLNDLVESIARSTHLDRKTVGQALAALPEAIRTHNSPEHTKGISQ